MTWKDVPGWLTEPEAHALALLAFDRYVLEIGSYLGRSTCAVAGSASLVVSVDWHRGDRDTGPGDTLFGFLKNLQACGVQNKVLPIIGRYEVVAAWLTAKAFDLVFVDASHDATSVERDTRLAQSHVKPGGVIAWHDWDHSSVREGVRACGVEPSHVVDRLAWLKVGV